MVPTTAEGSEILAQIRRARRRRRTADFDPFEALYRAYLTVILGGIAVWFGSGLVGDTRVKAAGMHQVLTRGPAVVGLAAGLVVAVGLRSGARGGPLALEAADVRHVLMAPIDRRRALGPAALRQVRFVALVGLAVGAVGGLLAYRRLGHSAPAWLASGALCALAVGVGSIGLAMVMSGLQVRRWRADGLAVVAVGWPALDLVLGVTTSPFTLLGQVALWPLHWRPAGLIAVALCALAALGGVRSVGGTSIEASERRSSLVGQLRFAATLRDLRTVMVLRRQLAQELPRHRPWFGLRPSFDDRWVVWRRGWHGISRFPARRLVRLALLGALGGIAALGAARGTTPLVAVAGLAFYVAALDAFEPLSQEIDHPDRTDGVPREAGWLMVTHLPAPAVVSVAVAVCGWAAALITTAALSGPVTTVVAAGAIAVVPAGLGGAAAGAISVVQGAPTTFSSGNLVLAPEVAGLRAMLPVVWPPIVAIIGVLPVLAAHHHRVVSGAALAVAEIAPLVLILVFLVALWVRWRSALHAWFRNALRDAGGAQAGGGGR